MHSWTDKRTLHVARFEFRKYLDLRGELIVLMVIALIAGIRFGGDVLMSLSSSDELPVVLIELPVDTPGGAGRAMEAEGYRLLPALPGSGLDDATARITSGTALGLLRVSDDWAHIEVLHGERSDWVEPFMAAFNQSRLDQRAQALGVGESAYAALMEAPRLSTLRVGGQEGGGLMAAKSTLIAFMVILVFGVMGSLNVILQGIVSEKFGRISEMVLSAIPVAVWLDGKLLAATAHGAKTLLVYSAYALIAALVLGILDADAISGIAGDAGNLMSVLCFASLGMLFWSCAFSFLAALMPSANSPVKNVFVFFPMSMLLVTLGGVDQPQNPFMVFLSFFPFTSSFAMPVRMLEGSAGLSEVLAATMLLLVACAAFRVATIRVFRHAVLNPGVTLGGRQLWRSIVGGRAPQASA